MTLAKLNEIVVFVGTVTIFIQIYYLYFRALKALKIYIEKNKERK